MDQSKGGTEMRNKTSNLETVVNNLLFLYTLFIVFACVVVFSWMGNKPEVRTEPETYNGFATQGELNAMRYLHRYHGTDYSENGVFYRDGVRHSLWDPRVRTDM